MRSLCSRPRPVSTPALCLTAEQEAARQEALEGLRQEAQERAREKAEQAAEWDRFMAEHRRKAEQEAKRSASPTAA